MLELSGCVQMAMLKLCLIGDSEEPTTPSDDTNSNETSSQRSLHNYRISNEGQRTAGDVLNDIGSMLADLTDELDAMLHVERDPNKA